MTTLLVIAAVVAWLYSRRDRRTGERGGAGASADARAAELRTPIVRITDALGIPTQRGRDAGRWAAGAEGERRTAARLAVLEREGWTVLHDRSLPRSRANVDHLLISPDRVVVVADSKLWSSRWPVTVSGGRLWHGNRDVTARLAGVRHEADRVASTLGIVAAVPVVVLDGPPLPHGPLRLDGIRIVSAADIAGHLRTIAAAHPHRGDHGTAARSGRLFPPYHR